MSELYHAWFSKQAIAAQCGSSVYRRPDRTLVEVTCVVKATNVEVPDKAGYAWSDAEYRGLVKEYAGAGRQSFEEAYGISDLFDFRHDDDWYEDENP